MTSAEKSLLKQVFPIFTSASLYGDYGGGHVSGVDVRDLSKFHDEEFSGIFSILLFDYVPELDEAFSECFRVLDRNGLFFTQIAPYRLVDGSEGITAKEVEKRPGYFDYIPGGKTLFSITVGRDRVVSSMQKAGFFVEHKTVICPLSKQQSDWFIGSRRPFSEAHPADAAQAADALRKKQTEADATDAVVSLDPDAEKLAEQLWNDPVQDPDKSKSVALFSQIAKSRDVPNAHYRLGCAYRYGFSVPKDNARALEYLSFPALDGWRSASYIKGIILSEKSFEGFDLAAARIAPAAGT